jgi:uncharacterized protein (DUF1800 family)
VPTPLPLVAHLYRRAGFGAPVSQLEALAGQSWTQLVNGIVDAAPESDDGLDFAYDTSRASWERCGDLRLWWFTRMATTRAPLAEKMTLFWHGHFCSGLDKCGFPQLFGQFKILRANALGNFRDLTKAVSLDTAMIVYLDNESNRAGEPQENFARELWELFMTGPGHYSQDEVVDHARAWTGHSTSEWKEVGEGWETHYEFKPEWHDNGPKTIFGRTDNFNGPDVIDWTLDGPKASAAAAFIARKLWSFFAYPNPEQSVVDALGAVLRSSGWNIRETMRALFMRPEFTSARALAGLVRSPTEYMVAGMRCTGLGIDEAHPEWFQLSMGQELFEPPDVSGWKQNSYWISTSAFSARAGFTQNCGWKLNETEFLGNLTALPPGDAVNTVLRQFEIVDPSPGTVQALRGWVDGARGRRSWAERVFLLNLIMLSPDFQLA